MKEQLARNISIYRKEKGLTQEELAHILGVSFQAISKWENAQTMPDISLLPPLSRTLEVSIDKLLGYASQNRRITIYEDAYKWYSGELLSHYHNWLIKDSSEVVFDCQSSGIPHKHAMTKLVAQKISSLD